MTTPRRITRRHVLAATGALAAAGALGVGGTLASWWDRPPGEGLEALSTREAGFVSALADAWMPPGGTPAIGGAEAGVDAFVDGVVATMSPFQRKGLKLLVEALDARPLPRHLARFQDLPRDTRTAVLDGWVNSSAYLDRQAISAVLALVSFGYTLHPEVTAFFRPHYGCAYGR